MRPVAWLLCGLVGFISVPQVQAWEEQDRGAYNNKMALLSVLLEGAQDRAGGSDGDLQTLCLLMSIGNDVTQRYVDLNPEDEQMEHRLMAMRNDLTVCLALLYNPTAASRF
ncbi:MAG: hypothetical protein CMN95_05060 [Synechococcus sp. MED650]|nr:hypothetical protein [Synechococcus sp. MED650]